jgi:hypothetical protein
MLKINGLRLLTLAAKKRSRRRQGYCEPRRSQKKQRISLRCAFFEFLCGKGLFLAGMREFRAPPPDFYFFEGVIGRD